MNLLPSVYPLMRIPREKPEPPDYVPYAEGGQTNAMAYADGWNDCRQHMIEQFNSQLKNPVICVVSI